MRINYERYLLITTEANSQKEAERALKSQFNALKGLCTAFGLTYGVEPGRRSSEGGLGYFVYPFMVKINAVYDFGSILELAAVIRAFAHFNAFEIGGEKVYPAQYEA